MRNNEKLHIIKHVRYRESDRTGEESFMKYDLEHYGQYLAECEKSKNTIEKYLRCADFPDIFRRTRAEQGDHLGV